MLALLDHGAPWYENAAFLAWLERIITFIVGAYSLKVAQSARQSHRDYKARKVHKARRMQARAEQTEEDARDESNSDRP